MGKCQREGMLLLPSGLMIKHHLTGKSRLIIKLYLSSVLRPYGLPCELKACELQHDPATYQI